MKRPQPGAPTLDVGDLQRRVEELRRAWDRFFQGLERVPPVPIRDQLARELNRARVRRDLASTDRFRLQQIQQRFNSYGRLWDRNLRQIEAGTFKRQVARAERRQEAQRRHPDADAYEAYETICKAAGMTPPNRSDFLAKLASKRQALETKHGHAVQFRVQEKGGRPSLMVVKADAD